MKTPSCSAKPQRWVGTTTPTHTSSPSRGPSSRVPSATGGRAWSTGDKAGSTWCLLLAVVLWLFLKTSDLPKLQGHSLFPVLCAGSGWKTNISSVRDSSLDFDHGEWRRPSLTCPSLMEAKGEVSCSQAPPRKDHPCEPLPASTEGHHRGPAALGESQRAP